MSDAPAVAVQAVEVPAPVQTAVGTAATPVPAKPKNAIQLIEEEIGNFFQQRENAIAKVHAIEGAIQAAQHLVAKLRVAEAQAAEEAKKLLADTTAEVAKAENVVEQVVKETVALAEKVL